MRWLIAIAFGLCLLWVMQQSSHSAAAAPPPSATDDGDGYICFGGAPRCQKASQCEAYCAGGTPVCFQGCCSCAS